MSTARMEAHESSCLKYVPIRDSWVSSSSCSVLQNVSCAEIVRYLGGAEQLRQRHHIATRSTPVNESSSCSIMLVFCDRFPDHVE
jgi:hypothetical protein